jgi:hypothetical protein
MAFDRFAYANNNALLYIDPSGGTPCVGDNYDDGPQCFKNAKADEIAAHFGVTFKGKRWMNNDKSKWAAVDALFTIGRRIASTKAGMSPWGAFRAVYHDTMTFGTCKSNQCSAWAYTKSGKEILFKDFYDDPRRNTRFIIHELGHAFDYMVCGNTDKCVLEPNSARFGLMGKMGTELPDELDGSFALGRKGYTGSKESPFWGFAGGWQEWQFGKNDETGEVFADMFLGWTFNEWGADRSGTNRESYMNQYMPLYVDQVTGLP